MSALLLSPAGLTSAAIAQQALQPVLQQQVEARLRQAGPGPRYGFVVTTEDGRELIAIAPDQRFMPGSNTKILTTAAAFELLAGIDAPDAVAGTAVRLEPNRTRAPA